MIEAPPKHTPETLLDWWIRSNGVMPLFAGEPGCVQLIATGMYWAATGMRNLAQVDAHGTYTRIIDPDATTQLKALRFSEMVAVFNPELPTCDCSLPDHLARFVRGGQLGFRAAVLEVGNGILGAERTAVLHLIVAPAGALNGAEDYQIIHLGCDGNYSASSVTGHLQPGWLMEQRLGLTTAPPVVETNQLDFCDESLGFPGALEFYTNAPRRLFEYLNRAAIMLQPNHKCIAD